MKFQNPDTPPCQICHDCNTVKRKLFKHYAKPEPPFQKVLDQIINNLNREISHHPNHHIPTLPVKEGPTQ